MPLDNTPAISLFSHSRHHYHYFHYWINCSDITQLIRISALSLDATYYFMPPRHATLIFSSIHYPLIRHFIGIIFIFIDIITPYDYAITYYHYCYYYLLRISILFWYFHYFIITPLFSLFSHFFITLYIDTLYFYSLLIISLIYFRHI